VVFLGDSITEWTAWEDWFPDLRTVNRGIGGQTIGDVLARLDTALVEPRAISLLIGTNDLHGLGRSCDVRDIAEQMEELVGRIFQMAPSVRLLINSILPRSKVFHDRILDLNRSYLRIADETGSIYIDAWSKMVGRDGSIWPELTADGLHLSIAGYAAWVELLRPQLAPFEK
jgi:lysophospholipase L1-like esterase